MPPPRRTITNAPNQKALFIIVFLFFSPAGRKKGQSQQDCLGQPECEVEQPEYDVAASGDGEKSYTAEPADDGEDRSEEAARRIDCRRDVKAREEDQEESSETRPN